MLCRQQDWQDQEAGGHMAPRPPLAAHGPAFFDQHCAPDLFKKTSQDRSWNLHTGLRALVGLFRGLDGGDLSGGGVGDGDWSPASTPRNWRGEAKRMKMLEVGRERWEECWKRTVEI